jgi:hypothetical protein
MSGDCDPQIGCCKITDPTDRALCNALSLCMRVTQCWHDDPFDCLCGTAKGLECIVGANGPCKAEVQAATKTTDPVQNGTLFYSFTVPAGFATQQIACDHDFCSPAASPPSNACFP